MPFFPRYTHTCMKFFFCVGLNLSYFYAVYRHVAATFRPPAKEVPNSTPILQRQLRTFQMGQPYWSEVQ